MQRPGDSVGLCGRRLAGAEARLQRGRHEGYSGQPPRFHSWRWRKAPTPVPDRPALLEVGGNAGRRGPPPPASITVGYHSHAIRLPHGGEAAGSGAFRGVEREDGWGTWTFTPTPRNPLKTKAVREAAGCGGAIVGTCRRGRQRPLWAPRCCPAAPVRCQGRVARRVPRAWPAPSARPATAIAGGASLPCPWRERFGGWRGLR